MNPRTKLSLSLSGVIISVIMITYIELTTCWSCPAVGITGYAFGLALYIMSIGVIFAGVFGLSFFHDALRIRKFRRSDSMRLSPKKIDYSTYLSAVAARLKVDDFDVEPQPDVSKMRLTPELASELAQKISGYEFGLFASKREKVSRILDYCAVIRADNPTIQFVEQYGQVVQRLSMARDMATRGAVRLIFATIVSSHFSADVTSYVENDDVLHTVLVPDDRKKLWRVLVPNPSNSRLLHLMLVPILVELETGKVFYYRKRKYGLLTYSLINRVRDRIREFFEIT